VAFAMVTTTLGLVAFASALERYFIRRATWLETGLFTLGAAGLFWPQAWGDLLGGLAFMTAIALQKFRKNVFSESARK
jgi:TRAP-type uncharacterized transport system fused permease subunit